MASDTYKLLMTIADSFVEQGKPLEAIKCLQAVCQSDRAEFPELDAEARLKLAVLLLDHTHSLKAAVGQLERASLVLGKSAGNASLKCSILARLAACHRHTGARKQLQATCEAALALCSAKGAATPEKEGLARWRLHFQMLLAQSHAAAGDPQAALACLATASQQAQQAGRRESEALLLLAGVQVRMAAGEQVGLPDALAAADAACSAAACQPGSAAAAGVLRLHLGVLRTAWLLQCGEALALMKPEKGAGAGTDPAAVLGLDSLSAQVAESDSDAAAAWLPPGCLAALAQVLCAAIWRPTGKFAKARAHLEKAADFLDAAKARLPLPNLQEAGEAAVPPQLRAAARQALWLRSLVLEHTAGIALTSSELTEAGGHICSLAALLQRFPGLLAGQRATLHLLAGSYCRETRESEAAVRHFEGAAACAADVRTRRMAAAQAALALAAQGSQPALLRALDTLKQHGLFADAVTDAAAPESAAGHQAAAAVLLRQGEIEEAKARLMKALKLAHATLTNNHTVAQIMCALAPTYLEGDPGAMKTMAESALKLSKGVSNLTLQAAAAELSVAQARRAGGSDGAKLPQRQEFAAQKQGELDAAVAAARTGEFHAQILILGSADLKPEPGSEATPLSAPKPPGKKRRR